MKRMRASLATEAKTNSRKIESSRSRTLCTIRRQLPSARLAASSAFRCVGSGLKPHAMTQE
jgi:hypothetical protein